MALRLSPMEVASPRFRKSLAKLAVFGGVVRFNLTARTLFCGVDDAGVEGPRIDVQADRPRIEGAGIEHTMHGLTRVDGARLGDIHLDGIDGFQLTHPGVEVLMEDAEIFNL